MHPKKNSLYFRKWNFLALILKNPYILSKESFSYISENGTLKFSAQALKIKELHPGKIYYTSRNKDPEKNYYVSGGNVYCLKKILYLIFFIRIFFIRIFFIRIIRISMSSVINIDFFFSLTKYLHSSKNT